MYLLYWLAQLYIPTFLIIYSMNNLPVCSNFSYPQFLYQKTNFHGLPPVQCLAHCIDLKDTSIYIIKTTYHNLHVFICKNSLYKTLQVISILGWCKWPCYSNVVPVLELFTLPGNLSEMENLQHHLRYTESWFHLTRSSCDWYPH